MGICVSRGRPRKVSLIRVSSISTDVRLANIYEFYKFQKVIGHGSYGTTRQAQSVIHPEQKFAIKTIDKSKIEDIERLRQELQSLMAADHPHVIKIFEAFEDKSSLHIVMELCEGGNLLHYIVHSSSFTEKEAAQLMKSLFSAVRYLHSIKICHRDLKFENIMMQSRQSKSPLKIIDFGLAVRFNRRTRPLSTLVGTSMYMAPEVLSKHYTKRCDNWSLGVILYQMLTGKFPFDEQNQLVKLSACQNINKEALDLINRLLVHDPTRRLSLKRCLYHPWIKKHEEKTYPEIGVSVLERLKNYNKRKLLEREVLRIIVKFSHLSRIEEPRRVFEAIDIEKHGSINAKDVFRAINMSKIRLAPNELPKIICNSGLNSNELGFTDFIGAICDKSELETEENLRFVFQHLSEGKPVLFLKDLLDFLQRCGRYASEDDFKPVFGDQNLMTFEDFQRALDCEECDSPIKIEH